MTTAGIRRDTQELLSVVQTPLGRRSSTMKLIRTLAVLAATTVVLIAGAPAHADTDSNGDVVTVCENTDSNGLDSNGNPVPACTAVSNGDGSDSPTSTDSNGLDSNGEEVAPPAPVAVDSNGLDSNDNVVTIKGLRTHKRAAHAHHWHAWR